jgi:hypothetical protein
MMEARTSSSPFSLTRDAWATGSVALSDDLSYIRGMVGHVTVSKSYARNMNADSRRDGDQSGFGASRRACFLHLVGRDALAPWLFGGRRRPRQLYRQQ